MSKSEETVECVIRIPVAMLWRNGKRYEPTGEYRPAHKGEAFLDPFPTIAGWEWSAARPILREVAQAPPKPTLSLWTDGVRYEWFLNGPHTGWRRVTPEELAAMGVQG